MSRVLGTGASRQGVKAMSTALGEHPGWLNYAGGQGLAVAWASSRARLAGQIPAVGLLLPLLSDRHAVTRRLAK
jgi:hypothetical protein